MTTLHHHLFRYYPEYHKCIYPCQATSKRRSNNSNINDGRNKPLHTHVHPSNMESKHNMQQNSLHHQRLMTNIKNSPNKFVKKSDFLVKLSRAHSYVPSAQLHYNHSNQQKRHLNTHYPSLTTWLPKKRQY